MIITVRQTGGYAGIDQPIGTVDTALLEPRAAAAVRARVAELTEEAERGQPVGADMFRFEVDVVEEGGPTRTFTMADESGTGELPRPLQEILGAA